MSEADARISSAFIMACRAELTALKPGNVHIFAPGHGMQVADFEISADKSAPFIAAIGWSVGARIRAAMDATFDAVGCNTNLGILLLCAPLAVASEQGIDIANILHSLTVLDAVDAFAAIRRANPGGLGQTNTADVGSEPEITLLEAMRLAADRDRIALQYTTNFGDILGFGRRQYTDGLARYGEPAKAVTFLYMQILQAFPDSHIARKYGLAKAQALQSDIQTRMAGSLANLDHDALLALDMELKSAKLNPGTAADLTVATVFSHYLR